MQPLDRVSEITCDVLVCGAGLGGVAAALRAARLGLRVCLTEEAAWPGGQVTTQGVSALDEHQYIETFGGTAAYYELRSGIRAYYRSAYRLSATAEGAGSFNPGNAWVSSLSFEPRAAATVLEAMMAGPHNSGALQVFYHTRAIAAEVYSGEVRSVLTRQTESGALIRFHAQLVLDATDLGDLLPLTATPYAVGAESQADTGEPSAPATADPTCLQFLTFPFAVEWRSGENNTIQKPDGYEMNRTAQPYTFVYKTADPVAPVYQMFAKAPGTHGAFWTYRRALDATNFDDPRIPNDVSIINWTSNDYRGPAPIDRTALELAALYRDARQLSLGFLYWLQTEAPRDDGGAGYPELRPRPDVMGTVDGVSQLPYIREGRRLKALVTIREQDIAASAQPGVRAAPQAASAGVGLYPIDLHGCSVNTVSLPTRPFQIPLGALVPQGTVNLLAAGKNIGTTHLTNGAYRVHPVEWAVGEAAGVLAAFCLRTGRTPHAVHSDPRLVLRLQVLALDQGIPLYWYDDVPIGHPAFAAAQLLAVANVWPGNDDTLSFRPDEPVSQFDAKRAIVAAAEMVQGAGGRASPVGASLRLTMGDALTPISREAAIQALADALPDAAELQGPGLSDPPTRADLAVRLAAVVRRVIEADRLGG
ncbi:MAG TPA: FAD-dependent oxidoreductase [bacterium]|nr:FAD-dependent oxidoreductase [bacterium]